MTMEETTKVLVLFGKNYTDFKKRMENKDEAKDLISLWNECFKDLPYELVLSGVKKTLLTSKYVPTIAEVRENCFSLVDQKNDVVDLWVEAYSMLQNGNYMSQEVFEKCPIECQKFFGNTSLLRAMSTQEDLNLDVVRSNFYKQMEIYQKREKQDKMLPQNLRLGSMVESLTKRIGG